MYAPLQDYTRIIIIIISSNASTSHSRWMNIASEQDVQWHGSISISNAVLTLDLATVFLHCALRRQRLPGFKIPPLGCPSVLIGLFQIL